MLVISIDSTASIGTQTGAISATGMVVQGVGFPGLPPIPPPGRPCLLPILPQFVFRWMLLNRLRLPALILRFRIPLLMLILLKRGLTYAPLRQLTHGREAPIQPPPLQPW